MKERSNNSKLENTCTHFKLVADKLQKENTDWKSKYMVLEHEKTQVQDFD